MGCDEHALDLAGRGGAEGDDVDGWGWGWGGGKMGDEVFVHLVEVLCVCLFVSDGMEWNGMARTS